MKDWLNCGYESNKTETVLESTWGEIFVKATIHLKIIDIALMYHTGKI